MTRKLMDRAEFNKAAIGGSKLTDSAFTDIQLREWLRSEHEHGSNFMQAIAEAALLADVQAYRLLRPVLIKLQETQGRNLPASPSK